MKRLKEFIEFETPIIIIGIIAIIILQIIMGMSTIAMIVIKLLNIIM